jgi:hypothetical protein
VPLRTNTPETGKSAHDYFPKNNSSYMNYNNGSLKTTRIREFISISEKKPQKKPENLKL